ADYGQNYSELNQLEIKELRRNHTDLAEMELKGEGEFADRGTDFEQWFFNYQQDVIERRDNGLEFAAQALENGSISKYEYDSQRKYYRTGYSAANAAMYSAKNDLDPDSVKSIENWLSENQTPEDKALSDYWDLYSDLMDKSSLPVDWDSIDAQLKTFIEKYDSETQEYIKRGIDDWINDLPETAKKVELERAAGIEDDSWWDGYRDKKVTTPSPSYVQPSSDTTQTGGTGFFDTYVRK
ncbi:MAG: hypothetical protein WC455_29820, partial [Dehalococcoidia bacterium]